MRPEIEYVILAKDPRASHTKTRLARDIGRARAQAIYETCLSSVVRLVDDTGCDWRIALYGDDEQLPSFEQRYAKGGTVTAQRGRTFAERQANEIERSLARGYRSCALVASDLPALAPEHLRWIRDRSTTAVTIVPCPDGGYSAIGSPLPLPVLAKVAMSTGDTMSRLIACIERDQLPYAVAPFAVQDVDEAVDLTVDLSSAGWTP